MDAARLKSLEPFSSLSGRERREVARYAAEVDIQAGEHLVEQGAFPYEFFVIVDGSAEVLRDGQHVADLGPGDILGEMAIFGDPKRNASVVAKEPMTAVVMSPQELRSLARSMPKLAQRIRRTIEERSEAVTG